MTIVLRSREPIEEPTVAVLIELRSRLTQDTRPYRIDTTGLGQPATAAMPGTRRSTRSPGHRQSAGYAGLAHIAGNQARH